MPDFDFSTLITDRSQADVDALESLLALPLSDWTAEQLAAFNQAISKGAYNYTDLNRVTACVDYLAGVFQSLGYQVPGYKKVEIPRSTSRLPDGYTELAYIESSGTQYIDTGFAPNQNTSLSITLQLTVAPTNDWPFGVRKAAGIDVYGAMFSSATSVVSWLGTASVTQTIADVTQKFLLTKTGAITTISYDDGAEYTITNQSSTFQSDYSLFLLNINLAGSPASAAVSAKIFDATLYNGSEKIREFVPCLNSDGEAGLYDLINGEFYANAGTGAFIAGPVPVNLPEGYTQVEYIQSSGTQYIDTGFKPSGGTVVSCKVVFPAKAAPAWLFGSRVSNNSQAYGFVTVQNYYRSDYNSTVGKQINLVKSEPFVLLKNGGDTYIDGSEVASVPSGVFQSTNNLFVFANNNNGSLQGNCSAALYYMKIYDGETLVRDYIPCRSPDGEVGPYDRIGSQFYGNAGSGTFTAGPEVSPPTPVPEPMDPYTWYESDIPTAPTMTAYLSNVAALRGVLAVWADTPAVPEDMTGLTQSKANDIEIILGVIETLINNMAAAWFFSGDLYSGEAEA